MSAKRMSRSEVVCGLLLTATLWLTRVRWLPSDDHFGAGLALPDASWAVFFLAGLLTRTLWWPGLLLVSCAALDYIALSKGVDSYCVTPAYPFLLPTYLSLWGMGLWASHDFRFALRPLLRTAAALCAGVFLAFVISNASFYWLSGYFAPLRLTTYVERVARYLPHFLLTTTLYVGFAGLCAYVWYGWRQLLTRKDSRSKL